MFIFLSPEGRLRISKSSQRSFRESIIRSGKQRNARAKPSGADSENLTEEQRTDSGRRGG